MPKPPPTSILQQALQNYTQNTITHREFQNILTENLQPELETDQDTTNLAHRAILEYFESVLVYASQYSFSPKTTDEFFNSVKVLLSSFKNDADINLNEFVENEIKNCVSKCEDGKTEIIEFLRTSFFKHLKLWKRFFHENRKVLHVREDKCFVKTIEAKSLKYALPIEYERLEKKDVEGRDEGQFELIKYCEAEAKNEESDSLEVDTDPKTEEIKKLTSFELKHSKEEIFELVKVSDKFDFTDNLEKFYQDLQSRVSQKSSELKQNYE